MGSKRALHVLCIAAYLVLRFLCTSKLDQTSIMEEGVNAVPANFWR